MTEQEKCNAGLTYRFDDPEMVTAENIPANSVAVGVPAVVKSSLPLFEG